MLLPVAVAGSLGEWAPLKAFLLSAMITGFVGGSLIFALGGRRYRLGRMDTLLLAGLVWALGPVAGAVPLYVSGHIDTYWLAYVEAVSGFTTTGATVYKTLEGLPRSVLVWRATLQWLGGGVTLVAILLLLAPSRLGGTPDAPLVSVESGARSVGARIRVIAAHILPVYASTTAACFLLLVVCGVPALDALCLAFSTLSTGGFSPVDGGPGAYDLPLAEMVLALFMWVGATSVVWQRLLFQSKLAAATQQRESWWMAAAILALGLAFSWGFYTGVDGPSGLSVWFSLQKGLVTAASVVSTTGLEFREGGFAAVSLPLLLFVAFIGGGGFSSAGGVKFFRLGAMIVQAGRELRRLVYPHSIRSARFGSQAYDIQLMKGIWSAFMAFGLMTALAAGVFSAIGLSFDAAMTAAVSAVSNAGPLYTALQPAKQGWLAFAEFGTVGHAAYTVAMIAGRLEVLALFAIFSPQNWRN